MSRLIDTADIYNRVQARNDLGVFRNTIGHIVMGIVGDCPTAEDKQAKKETINAVLEIIDDEQTNLMERLTITADGEEGSEADRMFELLERIKERLQED